MRRVSRRHVPRVACARVGREHRRVAHDLHEAIPSWPIRLKLHLGHLARGVGRAPRQGRHLPRSPDLACGGTSAPAHLAHLGWLREATSSKRASCLREAPLRRLTWPTSAGSRTPEKRTPFRPTAAAGATSARRSRPRRCSTSRGPSAACARASSARTRRGISWSRSTCRMAWRGKDAGISSAGARRAAVGTSRRGTAHALGLLPDGLELAAAHRLLGWVCDLQHPRSRLNARCSLMPLHMIVFTTVGIGR